MSADLRLMSECDRLRRELEAREAEVARLREALDAITQLDSMRMARRLARAALREEVSEPGAEGGHTSAVTTDVGASAHGDPPASGSIRGGPTFEKKGHGAPGSLTSPVDTARRMQAEMQATIDELPPAEPGTPRIVSVEVEPS